MEWTIKDRGKMWLGGDLMSHIYDNRHVQVDDNEYILKNLLHYKHLKNIDTVCARLAHAIKSKQKIIIVGDYDTDGATSTSLMMEVLSLFGSNNHDYIVPNRFEFNYGLSAKLVEFILPKSPDLIITVDNGISSVEGVDFANKHNIDVIITDHHLAPSVLPNAFGIINPNQPDDHFPSKNLAGVGVAFYTLLALRQHLLDIGHLSSTPNMSQYLDLVAIGTVADVVPLDFNNRILVAQGIELIKNNPRVGVKALIHASNCDLKFLSSEDIGFHIAPKLNAAGRLKDISIGIQCLLSTNQSTADIHANQLKQLNTERKAMDQQMALDATYLIEEAQKKSVITLYKPEWHQGVIGILASKIKEKTYKPTFVFAKTNDSELKGSARSIPGINLKVLLSKLDEEYPNLMNGYGGHAMAAGLSMNITNLENFSNLICKKLEEAFDPDTFQKVYLSDGILAESDISLKNALLIESNGPWGQGFDEPVFHGTFEITEQAILANKHLKLGLKVKNGNKTFPGIIFNVDVEQWSNIQWIEAIYKLKINRFKNRHQFQMLIVDARASNIHNKEKLLLTN